MIPRRWATSMARARTSTIRAASSTGWGLPPIRRGEAAALDVLEREVGQAVVLADLVDLDDVRVLDRGDGPGLGLEPDEVPGLRTGPGPDHLQGDEPVEPRLPRLVDDPHAAPAQHLQDLVAGDLGQSRPLGIERLAAVEDGRALRALDREGGIDFERRGRAAVAVRVCLGGQSAR